MKLPKNYRDILGYDALVYKDKGTVYVTGMKTRQTQAVSTSSDVVTFEDVADVIADRIAGDVASDEAINLYLRTSPDEVSSECPYCGL